METTSEPVIFNLSEHGSLLPAIASVHMACITVDGTIATFLPPLSLQKIVSFWENHTTDPNRTIIIHLITDSSGISKVAGVVILAFDLKNEPARFRGGVEKLLVSPDHRQQGIAKKMMGKLEELAREKGLKLLLLDTETESPAESVYPRLGWIKYGNVPNFEISPVDGKFRHNTFFYKHLEAI